MLAAGLLLCLGAVGDRIDDAVQHIPQVAALGAHPAEEPTSSLSNMAPHRGAGAVATGGSVQEGQQRGGGHIPNHRCPGEEILTVRANAGRLLTG